MPMRPAKRRSNACVRCSSIRRERHAKDRAICDALALATLALAFIVAVALNFTIMAFIIFIMVKQINRLKRETPPAPAEPPATPEDIALLREIRDSLRK